MKRNCGVLLRFTQEEKDALTEKAQKAGLSRERFCRNILNGAEVKEAPPAEYCELLREVRRIGYNINQLLKIANAMDRSHKQKFKNVKTALKDEKLIITVDSSQDITLEKGLLARRAHFFEEVFSVCPVIRQKG